MIRYSAAAADDSQFLKEVDLPKGSVTVFDRGYYDFTTLNRFTNDSITWVSRRRKLFTYEVLNNYAIENSDGSIISDQQTQLGWRSGIKVVARLVRYRDILSGEEYEFICNDFRMKATTIASLY